MERSYATLHMLLQENAAYSRNILVIFATVKRHHRRASFRALLDTTCGSNRQSVMQMQTAGEV